MDATSGVRAGKAYTDLLPNDATCASLSVLEGCVGCVGRLAGKDLERSCDVMQELKVQAVPCQRVEKWEAKARSPEVLW